MRNFLRATSLCAALLCLLSSCSEDELLTAPAGLKVGTLTATTAELSWNAVDGAESYNVSIDDGDPVSVTTASYTASGLTAETDYTWKVQAVHGSVVSDWTSGPGFTTSEVSSVPAPTDLDVTDITNSSATLSWQHPDADSHEVSIDDGEALPVIGLSHSASGLTPSTTYKWKVRSCKNGEWSDWAEGKEFTTEAVQTSAPTGLNFDDVTDRSAMLSWEHTDADVHEVMIDDNLPVEVTDSTYEVVSLKPETIYSWKVRSKKGDLDWSEWVNGEEFTTDITQFVYIDVADYFRAGQIYSDYEGYLLDFWSFDPHGSDRNGIYYSLDFIFGTELDDNPDKYILDIPEGTYQIVATEEAGTINNDGETGVTVVVDGVIQDAYGPISGTVTVEGDHNYYTITIDVVDDNGGFKGEYKGPYNLYNPYHTPTFEGNNIDIAAAFFTDFLVDYRNPGDLRHFTLELYDTDYLNTQGTGFVIGLNLYAYGATDPIIPDGTYTFSPNDPGHLHMTWGWVINRVNGHQAEFFDGVEGGTVSILGTGMNEYNITVDLTLVSGDTLNKTYSGSVGYKQIVEW